MLFDTKLGRVVTHCERLPPLNPYDALTMWPKWGRATIWKISISAFTRIMTTKLGRVLASGRSCSMQTFKSSPTSCFMLCSFFTGQVHVLLVNCIVCYRESSEKIFIFLTLRHCSKSKNAKVFPGALLPKTSIGETITLCARCDVITFSASISVLVFMLKNDQHKWSSINW